MDAGAQSEERKKRCFQKVNMCFHHGSWALPPMAPFPLALFLISGNHIPLLLLLTACGSNFFLFLGGRKKTPHICQVTYSNLALGSQPLVSVKDTNLNPLSLCNTNLPPCRVPLISTRWFRIHQPGGKEPAPGPPWKCSDGHRAWALRVKPESSHELICAAWITPPGCQCPLLYSTTPPPPRRDRIRN